MSAVGPASADGAASGAPPLLPLPPSPPPLCRAPTLSRLSPGAGARGRAGGGARRWAGARAPHIPPPPGPGEGGAGARWGGQAPPARLRTWPALWLRPPQPERCDWFTGKCRPTFLQSRSRILFLARVPLVAQIELFVSRLRYSSPTLVCVGVRKAEAKRKH